MRMRILFAAPDRDLIESYQLLLTPLFGDVATAFDGTQVLSLLDREKFDILVMDEGLPRVDSGRIVERLEERGTPVIMLKTGAVTVRQLTEPVLPNALLPYPFEPAELAELIRRVTARAAGGPRIAAEDVTALGFRLEGGPRLTERELELLEELAAGGAVREENNGAYLGALNEKFMAQNVRARIRYRAGEGYRLVSLDE